MGPTQEGKQGETDSRHDERLTVVDVTTSKNRQDTIIEAIATTPGKTPCIRWFRLRLKGVHNVAFGWLIGMLDETHARLHWHADEPGIIVNLRCRAAQFTPRV